MSTRKPTETTFDIAAIVRALESPFAKADAERATNLASLAKARQARGYMRQRTRDARAAKLGPDAAEVVALDERIATNAGLATTLAMESALATRSAPTAAEGEVIVHGFVVDGGPRPVEGVQLTLAAGHGEALATAASAKDGSYVLRVRAREVPQQLELRVHDKRHPDPVEVARTGGTTFVMVRIED